MKRRLFTLEDIRNSKVYELNKHLFENELPKVGKSKYGNMKTKVDGEMLDSKKEAKRWKILRLRLKAGEIGYLSRQVEFELNPGGTHSLIYKADFVYREMKTGELVVEDVKGMRTREYLKKKRLMKKVHNITITEI